MSEKSNEFTREYVFDNPLMPPVMCRPNCCLFCRECTDIFYDLYGPYGIVCLKGRDFETGMLGKCKAFNELIKDVDHLEEDKNGNEDAGSGSKG